MRTAITTEIQSSGIPQQIRDAVGSGAFDEARLLWEQYGQQFRADLLRGPLPLSRMTEARELAEWTRMAALCARAHAQDRLNQIAVSQKYGWPAAPPLTTVSASF